MTALLSQVYQIIDQTDLSIIFTCLNKFDLTEHVQKNIEKESICFCRRLLEIDMVIN
jgi:hypothetical protein